MTNLTTEDILGSLEEERDYDWLAWLAGEKIAVESRNLNKVDKAELQIVFENCIKYSHTLNVYIKELVSLLEKDMVQ